MFLVLFGGIFNFAGSSKIDVIQVGEVALVDDLPDGTRAAFDETFEVTRSSDRAAALAEVRKGDTDVMIEQEGNTLVAHYTQTDQTAGGRHPGNARGVRQRRQRGGAGPAPDVRLPRRSGSRTSPWRRSSS